MFIVILILFSFTINNAYSETGIPLITNYSPKTYNAHGQNWQIVKGPKGSMYFANTDGVLINNGVSWELISLPNYVITRSLAVDSIDIYVGAQDELGVLKPDSLGFLKYSSFLELLPDSVENFGDIWHANTKNNSVFFLSRQYLFQFDKNKQKFSKIYKARSFFHTMFKANNRILIQQPGLGLCEIKNNNLITLKGFDLIRNNRVYAILALNNNTFLIGTRTDGLFIYKNDECIPYKTEIDNWLKKNQFYNAVLLSDSSIALATLRGGIAVVDKQGKVKLFIDKSSGLQDNSIWNLYADKENNLWMALNKGISKAYWPVFFSQFNERNGLVGNVQSVVRFKENIYVATGLGVFILEKKNGRSVFRQLDGLSTQCWHLAEINNRLFVSCNTGIWEIKDNKFIKHAAYSSWKLLKWNKHPEILFAGLDDGLAMLRLKKDGSLSDLGKVEGIDVEARTLAQDSLGAIWIGTSRQGVVKVSLEKPEATGADVKIFDETDGLPGMNFNLVYQGLNSVFITTAKGIFVFDYALNKIMPVKKYNQHFPTERSGAAFYSLAQDKNGNIWINNGLKPALFQEVYEKFIEQRFKAFPEMLIYCIYPEENGVWFGGPDGLIYFDKNSNIDPDNTFNARIHSITSNNDSLRIGPFYNNRQFIPEIAYQYNALRFKYSSTSYLNEKANQFQYKLEGFDNSWSKWTSETQRDYTNLFEGKYRFKVRAKNVYDKVAEEASFSFIIVAPWYRSYPAYAAYLLIFIFLIYEAVRYRAIRMKHKNLLEQQKFEQLRQITEEDLRKQMAADFHDELGNKITRISLFAELIKQNKKISGDVISQVNKISENANTLYSETRDFIWQLDPQKDTLLDTITRVKNFGDELFSGTETEFIFINNAQKLNTTKLNMDFRRQIIRILKEALHNALKHAKSRKVIFKVDPEENYVLFNIRDFGKGIDKLENATGNGLNNMKQRSEKIKADLYLKNEKPGTSIKLNVKLP